MKSSVEVDSLENGENWKENPVLDFVPLQNLIQGFHGESLKSHFHCISSENFTIAKEKKRKKMKKNKNCKGSSRTWIESQNFFISSDFFLRLNEDVV